MLFPQQLSACSAAQRPWPSEAEGCSPASAELLFLAPVVSDGLNLLMGSDQPKLRWSISKLLKFDWYVGAVAYQSGRKSATEVSVDKLRPSFSSANSILRQLTSLKLWQLRLSLSLLFAASTFLSGADPGFFKRGTCKASECLSREHVTSVPVILCNFLAKGGEACAPHPLPLNPPLFITCILPISPNNLSFSMCFWKIRDE